MLLFYVIVEFLFTLWWGFWYANMSPFDKIQVQIQDTCKCRVSDTQAIDKAWEYLVQ